MTDDTNHRRLKASPVTAAYCHFRRSWCKPESSVLYELGDPRKYASLQQLGSENNAHVKRIAEIGHVPCTCGNRDLIRHRALCLVILSAC